MRYLILIGDRMTVKEFQRKADVIMASSAPVSVKDKAMRLLESQFKAPKAHFKAKALMQEIAADPITSVD